MDRDEVKRFECCLMRLAELRDESVGWPHPQLEAAYAAAGVQALELTEEERRRTMDVARRNWP